MKYFILAIVVISVTIESKAIICDGCGTRPNTGANYCSNCGKKFPTSSLETQYESLMREALPKLLGDDSNSNDSKVNKMILKEMSKFRAMNPARQKKEYEEAKAAIAKMKLSSSTKTTIIDQTNPQAVARAYLSAYANGNADTLLKLSKGLSAEESLTMRSIAALFKEGKQFSAKVMSNEVRIEKQGDVIIGFMTLEVNGKKTEMHVRMKKFDGKWFVVK